MRNKVTLKTIVNIWENKSDGLINIDKYIVTSLMILKQEYSEYEQNFDRMIISCKK